MRKLQFPTPLFWGKKLQSWCPTCLISGNNADRGRGKTRDPSFLTLFSQASVQNVLYPGANSSGFVFCGKRSELFGIQQEDRCLRHLEKTNGTNESVGRKNCLAKRLIQAD